jgi:hypothetical protein
MNRFLVLGLEFTVCGWHKPSLISAVQKPCLINNDQKPCQVEEVQKPC